MSVHQREKSIIVMPLNKVGEFMNDQVFEALHRLLCKFEVQPDAARIRVARPPFGLHLLYAPVRGLDTENCLPLCQQRKNESPQLPAIPTLQYTFTFAGIRFAPDMQ